MSKTKLFAIILLVAISISAVPMLSQAQFEPAPAPVGGLQSSILGCDRAGGVLCIVTTVLRFLLSLAFAIAMVFVVIAGYRFVTSSGNEEAVTAAKKQLLWAVSGAVLIALSWIILTIIINIAITGDPGK